MTLCLISVKNIVSLNVLSRLNIKAIAIAEKLVAYSTALDA